MDANLWKSKEEMKKYLENLGTEYRYGCFEENKPEVCHLLGDYLTSIDKADAKAAQLYRKNCDENKYGLSCDTFGRMLFKGQGVEKADQLLAFEYFKKGCDLDEPRSCYHGGQLIGIVDRTVNRTIKPDPVKALEMLTKSCLSTKLPASCTLVHSFYLKGFHNYPADLKKAAEFAKIACDQDELTGCYNLSRMYHIGEGVDAADQEKSKHFFKRAQEIKKGLQTDHGKKTGKSDI